MVVISICVTQVGGRGLGRRQGGGERGRKLRGSLRSLNWGWPGPSVCARPWADSLMWMILFRFHDKLHAVGPLLFQGEGTGSERSVHRGKVTQPVQNRARLHTGLSSPSPVQRQPGRWQVTRAWAGRQKIHILDPFLTLPPPGPRQAVSPLQDKKRHACQAGSGWNCELGR